MCIKLCLEIGKNKLENKTVFKTLKNFNIDTRGRTTFGEKVLKQKGC